MNQEEKSVPLINEVANLKRHIEELQNRHRRELAEESARTEAATFRAEIAEWAVRGVAARNVSVHIDGTMLAVKGVDLLGMVRTLGESAGQRMIHEAGLAFRSQANHHAALAHIRYLENHAAACGVAFRAYEPPDPAGIPERWYRPLPR